MDAMICDNCGETYYDPPTSDQIQAQVELAYNTAEVEMMKV